MLLRAQAVGQEPSLRFVIMRVDTDEPVWWDGQSFVDDVEFAQLYARPSDACFQMQDILKDHYGQLPKRRFVVPIEIEVYGDVTNRDIAEYLHRASVLSIRTEEFGNGPKETYVAPVIHWGYIRQIDDPVKGQIDDLAKEWNVEEIQ